MSTSLNPLGHELAHAGAADFFFAARAHDVASAVAVGQNLLDRLVHGIGLFGQGKGVAQQHAHGQDGGQRIGQIPPGNVRRFDTRFFLAFTDEAAIDPAAISDSAELHDLRWLDMADLSSLNMPSITRTILDDVKAQMQTDPSLPFGSDGPFYFSRHGRFFRETI